MLTSLAVVRQAVAVAAVLVQVVVEFAAVDKVVASQGWGPGGGGGHGWYGGGGAGGDNQNGHGEAVVPQDIFPTLLNSKHHGPKKLVLYHHNARWRW